MRGRGIKNHRFLEVFQRALHVLRGSFLATLPGPADEFLGTQSNRERHGEHDASERNSKSQFDDFAPDSEVFHRHGAGEDQDKPLHADADQPGRLQLHIDGANEYSAGNKTCKEDSENQNDSRSDDIGEIGEHREASFPR